MFTLLVSWLLAALVPGLLMLATLGLGRLEKELAPGSVTTTDVDEFVENANAVDVHTLAREGMPEALDYLHRRQAQRALDPPPYGRHARPEDVGPLFGGDPDSYDEADLPTQLHQLSPQVSNQVLKANPEVKATRHVNRV
jgi:hypothetical protein